MTDLQHALLDQALALYDHALVRSRRALTVEEFGRVISVDGSVMRVDGLPGVASEELVELAHGAHGLVIDVDPGGVGVALLGSAAGLAAGSEVRRTGREVEVPVGDALLGRVVDPLGRPLDRLGPIRAGERRAAERAAPDVLDRAPVEVPLRTGIIAVDAMIPIGRGQRELLVGDRQTGKTAIAIDAILNQADQDVLCVYCAIGQRSAAVARVVDQLRGRGAMAYTTVVLAEADAPPGLHYIAPYAATAIAEYFMERGRDVLVVYDDLTRHARAYRELALLLRRPPGREAFPGDIFYLHARLLERATHLNVARGGGSLTALPIVELEEEDLTAYIPTNLISITDGQIYLSPALFQRGQLPAIDVGRSVSRVGGKAQVHAYQQVAADLRLAYAQFEELETFARFGTRLDERTRARLERGHRVREVLKQPELAPIATSEQVAVLLAVIGGLFDSVPRQAVGEAAAALRHAVRQSLPGLCFEIDRDGALNAVAREALLETARTVTEHRSAPWRT